MLWVTKIKVTFYNRSTVLHDGNVKNVESLLRHMTERNTNISQNTFLQLHIIYISTQNCHQSNLSSLFCQIYAHLTALYLNVIIYVSQIYRSQCHFKWLITFICIMGRISEYTLTLGSKIKKNWHMVTRTFCLIFFFRVFRTKLCPWRY